MKKLVIIVAMLSVLSNAFAKNIIDQAVGTTISPFGTTIGLSVATSVLVHDGRFVSPFNTVQARGVAGKEQLRDEL